MKEIWVMRHAKSEWSHPDLTDFDRPLNKRGKRDAPRMGEWIRLYGSPPELIVSSPAKRAKATTRAVADVMGTKALLQWWDELYPGDVDATMKRIRQLSNEIDRIMVVGHNPHQGDLVSYLAADGHLRLRLPTAAIVLLAGEIESWKQPSRSRFYLKGFVSPKLLE
jgi:phosphohistidine phosphatase